MISSLFSNPIIFFISLISLFIAITIHEYSHAWMADRLGDPTARLQDRLSFNPLRHIDLTGLLFLLFFGFGWGKPVPVDPYNLKNPQKDSAMISVAGPLSNLVLASILSILIRLFILFHLSFASIIGLFLLPIIQMNVVLGIFNLLPIEPLDGFKIVGGLLPGEKAREWEELRRYGLLFLLVLIFPIGRSSMLDIVIRPIISFIIRLLIPSPFMGGFI